MEPDNHEPTKEVRGGNTSGEDFHPPPANPYKAIFQGRWSEIPGTQKLGVMLIGILFTAYTAGMLYVNLRSDMIGNGAFLLLVVLLLAGFIALLVHFVR